MPAVGGIITDTVRRDTHLQRLVVEMLKRSTIARLGTNLETLNIKHRSRLHHHLDIARVLALELTNIAVLKVEQLAGGRRDDIPSHPEGQQKQKQRRPKVRQHETVKTHTRSQYGDNLGVACQFTGEENDGNEYEQLAEHIHIIRYKIEVIVKHNLPKRHLVVVESVHLLRQVEHNGNRHHQNDGEEIRPQKLLYYIPINEFHGGVNYDQR